MREPATLFIVDDHRSSRDMLRAALDRPINRDRYQIVGEAGTGLEAIEQCLRLRPRLIVLDVVLPGERNGVEVLNAVRKELRSARVVFFSGCQQDALISQALAGGAAAYVSKTQSLQILLDAIAAVEAGKTYFDPEIAHLLTRAPVGMGSATLTGRERDVARLIAQGKSTKEAAEVLGVSVKTLDKHRTRMMKKLRLHDAVAVTRYAIQSGIVSLP